MRSAPFTVGLRKVTPIRDPFCNGSSEASLEFRLILREVAGGNTSEKTAASMSAPKMCGHASSNFRQNAFPSAMPFGNRCEH
jgi:hypothetical protein